MGLQPLSTTFARAADCHASRIAVQFGPRQISFGAFRRQVDELAGFLRQSGLVRGAVVAVAAPRSPELLAWLLAILKAGGAFLPIDPAYPAARIDHMLRQSRVYDLVGTRDVLERIDCPPARFVDIADTDRLTNSTRGPPESAPRAEAAPSDLAYVLYTSGSTGLPKGVAVTHGNLAARHHALAERLPPLAGKRVLAATTISFDIALFETLLALASGATVVLADERQQVDFKLLRDLIVDGRVDIVQLTPTRLQLLLADDPPLTCLDGVSTLLLAGERVPDGLLARLGGLRCRIFNLYGPTEATIYALTAELFLGEPVNIGYPLAATSIQIVDRHGGPILDHSIGELWIGGAGVAQGYHNDGARTAERFIGDPFGGDDRLYRTGDLVNRGDDGRLYFHGRVDRQLKIRGHRVEPGEIETVLLRHPGVQQASVRAWEDAGYGAYLSAYVVPRGNGAPDPAELRDFLRSRVPEYMVPTTISLLAVLPLTPSGKTDQAALPCPKSELRTPIAAATKFERYDQTQARLAEIWSDVLNLPPGALDLDVSFFAIGGHSLRAALMLSRVAHEMRARVLMAEFFEQPTLRALARRLETATNRREWRLHRRRETSAYPLSSEQKRMYFLDQLARRRALYNISEVYRLSPATDPERIRRGFERLIARHSSLRSAITLDPAGVLMQTVDNVAALPLAVVKTSRAALDDTLQLLIAPFDLARPPLLRIALVIADEAERYLLIDMHHIAVDGVSRDVLFEEFYALAEGAALPPLAAEYRDHVAWQTDAQDGEHLREQQQFWLDMFRPRPAPLRLPLDRPRPKRRSFRGGSWLFRSDAAATRRLKALARENGATLFMTLFAATSVLLARLCDQDDVVIGTPIAGRRHAELERTVGMFVNTLPIRSRPQRRKSFIALLGEIRQTVLQAIDHQDYQFDELVARLGGARQRDRNPLFDVMFVLQDTETKPLAAPGMEFVPYRIPSLTAKVDLLFQVNEEAGELIWRIEYDTDLFGAETIASIADRMRMLLRALCEASDRAIGHLQIDRLPLDLDLVLDPN